MVVLSGNPACIAMSRDIVSCVIYIISSCLFIGSISAAVAAGNPEHDSSNLVPAGAIIGDGDRKSWDPRGPMIWDNFSIFRTNCAILTSWIHARVRRGFTRGCCHVA